jgi:hypothetical protein
MISQLFQFFFKCSNIRDAPHIIGSSNWFISMGKFWHRAAANRDAAGNDDQNFIHMI